MDNFLQYIIYTDVMLLASLAWTRKGHPPFWIRVWGCFGENRELPIAAATKINIKWMCPHCETLAVTFTIPVFKSWVQSTKKNFLHIYNWRKDQSCLSSAYVLLRKGVTQLLELHLESLAVCKGRAVFPESFLVHCICWKVRQRCRMPGELVYPVVISAWVHGGTTRGHCRHWGLCGHWHHT